MRWDLESSLRPVSVFTAPFSDAMNFLQVVCPSQSCLSNLRSRRKVQKELRPCQWQPRGWADLTTASLHSSRLVAAPLLLPSKPNLKQSRRRNLETIVFPGSTAKPAEMETEISLGMLPFEREEEEGGGRKKRALTFWGNNQPVLLNKSQDSSFSAA